jgi:UDP-N-acetylmuramoyl-L-alanyl-D-glutamate--2,6-diaminopimelate ligase
VRLHELLTSLPWPRTSEEDIEITGIASDSRQVKPGDLFVALKGFEHDGHQFIPEALARGARALVVEEAIPEVDLPLIVLPNSRRALAHLGAAWYRFPSQRLRLIGVTGTDGKTTTVSLVHAILETAGQPTGMVTSVNAIIGEKEMETGLHTTTPDALELQNLLARMVQAGCQYAVIEATSHGLAQYRLEACHFDVATITNITHEHLDYHKTFAEYREAKARLFRSLAISARKPNVSKVSVLNADDPSFDYLKDIHTDKQIVYGLRHPADVTAEQVDLLPTGTRFTAQTPAGSFPIQSPLVGEFNVYNLLAAIAVATSQDVSFGAIQEGVSRMSGVPGRMEKIDLGQPFPVIIDFAHTPNALRHALEIARLMTSGRLFVVFGCAGLRDRAKRPMMGEIAAQLADRVIITAEDPRTEDLSAIMEEIARGCEKVGREKGTDFWQIGDRAEAIQFAIDRAEPGDLVIITGKGHEKSMCFGTTEYPWSDHEAVREALERRKRK